VPKLLLDRCGPDCVLEFRRSAILRFREGSILAGQGHGTSAIYLWGYAAEMTLKAAYFRLSGFTPTQAIHLADLRQAAFNHAPTLGITWPRSGWGHHVENGAELLVRSRFASGHPYPIPLFGQQVVAQSRAVYRLWRETLRYHKNRAYGFELSRVQTATAWLIDHRFQL
jgi:hypothetical protein